MTTAKSPQTSQSSQTTHPFRLPDIPRREPDEMTSYDHLHRLGSAHHLIHYLGNPETTLVEAERYIVPGPGWGGADAIHRYPDLFIAFNVNPARYKENNGYVITEQGKAPDFVLEVASVSTGRVDVGAKREDYAALGIPEYWRFDETGEYHGARLAGDRLVEGVYVPLVVEELADGSLQGYSEVLNLYLRWEEGRLGWHDPATGQHIPTYDDQRRRAEQEREARQQAEARIRELEAENRRLRGG